ncbi:MAG: WD40/YVTN/BNR-like repeat-containing protein [Salinirussus sp.]
MEIVLATDTGLCIAQGNGEEWTANWYDPGVNLECVAAGAVKAFAGTADGRVLMATTGTTWEVAGSMADRVTALAISPHDPEVVWAGTEPSRLYQSRNGGRTWRERPGLADLPSADRWSFPPRPDTHHVRWILEDPAVSGHLSLAIEAGALIRSTDGGETFLDHPDGARRDNHTVASHEDEPERRYVAAGDGYAESPDRGDTWRYPQEGLEHRYVWGLAIAPDDPEEVFVSAASGAFAAHDTEGTSYVYRRRDGRWERAMDGLPGPDGLGRAVLATGNDSVLAATNHGVFRRDEGIWTRLGLAWPDRCRQELPRGLAVLQA